MALVAVIYNRIIDFIDNCTAITLSDAHFSFLEGFVLSIDGFQKIIDEVSVTPLIWNYYIFIISFNGCLEHYTIVTFRCLVKTIRQLEVVNGIRIKNETILVVG